MAPNLTKDRKCPHCSKIITHRSNFARHLTIHAPNAQLKCQICHKVFKSRSTLGDHVRYMHKRREHPSCKICHRKFSSHAYLRRHVEVHSMRSRPRLPCTFPGCAKSFLNRGTVLFHFRIEHSEHQIRFPCTFCGKQFKTRTPLELHIATHTTEKPHKCTACGRRFAQLSKLKSHQMTHQETSARPKFPCDLCPKKFLSKPAMKIHYKIWHQNEQNYYPCTICDRRLMTPAGLKFHTQLKHLPLKGPLYSCDKCEYKTSIKSNLARHKKVRHDGGKKGSECYFCGYKFFTFTELVIHCRRMHGVE